MDRIAISGSHGVGKSRLTKQLSELLLLPKIGEVARSVADGWFADSDAIKNASPGQKLLFQLCVFHKQIHEETKLQEFVSDRSVFDAVAYSIYYRIPKKITDSLAEEAVKHSKTYDLIIYCPIPEGGGVPTADGFRFTDGESRAEVDRILQDLLKKAECEVLRLGPYRETWLSESATFINCRRKGIKINTAPLREVCEVGETGENRKSGSGSCSHSKGSKASLSQLRRAFKAVNLESRGSDEGYAETIKKEWEELQGGGEKAAEGS